MLSARLTRQAAGVYAVRRRYVIDPSPILSVRDNLGIHTNLLVG